MRWWWKRSVCFCDRWRRPLVAKLLLLSRCCWWVCWNCQTFFFFVVNISSMSIFEFINYCQSLFHNSVEIGTVFWVLEKKQSEHRQLWIDKKHSSKTESKKNTLSQHLWMMLFILHLGFNGGRSPPITFVPGATMFLTSVKGNVSASIDHAVIPNEYMSHL